MGSLRYWSRRLKVRSLFVSVAAALLVFGSASPAFAVQLNGLEEGEVSGGPATVPDEYVYDHQGDHMQPGDDAKLYKGRHDWCTSSPDQPGVDFRGPCARHDMCYDANPNAVPTVKSEGKMNCDEEFRSNLYANCNEKYATDPDSALDCRRTADGYVFAVEQNGGKSGDPKPPIFN